MNRRRHFLIVAAATSVARPLRVFAQARLRRIGFLSNDPYQSSAVFSAFAAELRELGWIEGKNIEIKFSSSAGRDELYPDLARAMVKENVEVIVTTGSPSTIAARAATSTIPIVFGSAGNPVEQGFVASLARPGGNTTGLELMVQELGPKRVEILRDLLPDARRFARLYDPRSLAKRQPDIMNDENRAAADMGLTMEHIAVERREDLPAAFERAKRLQIQAMHATAASLLVVFRKDVAGLALKHRIPLMGPDRRFTHDGVLLSYGENFAARYRRAAVYVDKILRGTKPGELPVERPENFELVLNRKTAAELGLKIPATFKAHRPEEIG